MHTEHHNSVGKMFLLYTTLFLVCVHKYNIVYYYSQHNVTDVRFRFHSSECRTPHHHDQVDRYPRNLQLNDNYLHLPSSIYPFHLFSDQSSSQSSFEQLLKYTPAPPHCSQPLGEPHAHDIETLIIPMSHELQLTNNSCYFRRSNHPNRALCIGMEQVFFHQKKGFCSHLSVGSWKS